MRRLLIPVGLVALALAGCGSASSSPSTAPLGSELSYFPAGSPLVAVLATNPTGVAYQDASGFVARFPIARLGLSALQSSIARSGINYDQDVKPLLGNPVAIGAPTTSTASQNRFLLVFVAKDAGKLAALTARQPAPQSAGSYDGAKLYRTGSYALAISGATALLSSSLDDIKSSLDLHVHGGGISAAQYTQAFAGLPQNTLLRLYGNLTTALSTPKAAKARLIPWVAAIRSYAATVGIADTGISVSYRVDTTGRALTASQLPLPLGSTPPSAAGRTPVVLGGRDLAQEISFVEGAVRAVDPQAWSRASASASKHGIDLKSDLISQFTGNGELDYSPSGWTARAELAHATPGAAHTLSKFKNLKAIGGGFYQSTTSRRAVRVGIVGDRLVAGQATVAQLRALAAQPASPIAGAAGPVAFRISLGSLVSLALAASHSNASGNRAMNAEIQAVLGAFGTLTGWTAEDASGLYGNVSLPLK